MIGLLLVLHSRLQFTILLVMLILAVWGLINFLRQRGITANYQGSLVFGLALFLVESLIGLMLLASGLRPLRLGAHILYGLIGVITLPLILSFIRIRPGRWSALICAMGCLFLAGIAMRALITAQG